jgi:hypothetical protein
MAEDCSPPWPDPEDGPRALENVLDSALAVYRPNRFGAQLLPPIPSRKTLCAALGITAELAEDLDLQVLHLRPTPSRRKAAEIAADGAARRELLRAYITENPYTSAGEAWSLRNIRDRVPGYDVSHETARKDKYILFPKAPRGRRRRIPAIGGLL